MRLQSAYSDRARNGRVHVATHFVDAETPSTLAALAVLRGLTERSHVLVVAARADELTWKSLRNAAEVHLIAADQLNTYDVLCSDDVVFTRDALEAFLGRAAGEKTDVDADEAEKTDVEARKDGRLYSKYPDGTEVTLEAGPDPRWGLLAPAIEKLTVRTPGGRTKVTTEKRRATFSPSTAATA